MVGYNSELILQNKLLIYTNFTEINIGSYAAQILIYKKKKKKKTPKYIEITS